MAALLALFHLAAIISLMRMMKSTLKTDEASTPSVFDEPQSMKKKWTNKELSQGYRTLVLHCILIATAQLLCVGVALAFYFGVNRFSQAGWRTAAPVIEMIPTSIVTPALLIHKLLEMIDKKKTPVVSFSQISCPTLPSFAGRLSTENNSGPTRVENNLLRKDTEKSESEKSERNCGSVKTKSASNSCTTSLSENLV
ncbi:expressed protein [Phakopsora pachyrhizi]|uniref:Expressed protein n=1 Tax=Phakopsora pachyrhizi TaxID=170000 RepID=A0AAV0BDD0_PHAPC|nr:expressed protein [Phakopsora pachyrhizi]